MVEDPQTKLIFTVRENSECDGDSDIPFVVWDLNEDIQARLAHLAQLAQKENITVVTNEFELFDGADRGQPLKACLSLSSDEDPILDLEMQKPVRKMWPVEIITESDIPVSFIMMAMAPPTHLKRPVAVVTPNCDTDMVVFEGPEDEDRLHEVVLEALDAFQEYADGQEALRVFCETIGLDDAYRFTKNPIKG